MAQVVVNLRRVQVFESEEMSSVNLVFNEAIEGFKKVVDNHGVVSYEKGDVTSVSIPRGAFTAQLCDVNDDIALYRGCIGRSFNQKDFTILLNKAVLTLNRELKSAGEVYGQSDDGTDLCYARDCYTTEVVDVKLDAKTIEKLDNYLQF